MVVRIFVKRMLGLNTCAYLIEIDSRENRARSCACDENVLNCRSVLFLVGESGWVRRIQPEMILFNVLSV